jgi:hypothetical protein
VFRYDVYDAEPDVVYRDAEPEHAVESKVVGVLVVGLASVAAAAADDDLLFVVTVAVPAKLSFGFSHHVLRVAWHCHKVYNRLHGGVGWEGRKVSND